MTTIRERCIMQITNLVAQMVGSFTILEVQPTLGISNTRFLKLFVIANKVLGPLDIYTSRNPMSLGISN